MSWIDRNVNILDFTNFKLLVITVETMIFLRKTLIYSSLNKKKTNEDLRRSKKHYLICALNADEKNSIV
jgi:hypothetical protein